MNHHKVAVVLDNIRSAENVGAIFRTADAVGVSLICICGLTPSPLDRFGRKVSKIQKSALGAEDTIPWEYFDSTEKALTSLKKKGFEIVSLEQDPQSILYTEYTPKGNFALVVGNEVDGVSLSVRKKSDVLVEIPMRGEKESLNVSVATGIALYGIVNR